MPLVRGRSFPPRRRFARNPCALRQRSARAKVAVTDFLNEPKEKMKAAATNSQPGRAKDYRLAFPMELPVAPTSNVELVQSLVALDRLFPQPSHCFGMDQKVQYHLETAEGTHQSRKTFYRIPQEPVILGSWLRLARLDFTLESSLDFASLLGGKETVHRSKDVWAMGLGNLRVLFETADKSKSWISDLCEIRSRNYDPVTEAAVSYARMVFAHPFRDGNGRFARAIAYGSLARHRVLRSPCLGLSAGFDRHRQALAHATAKLSESADWSGYLAVIAATLASTCEMALAVRAGELASAAGR